MFDDTVYSSGADIPVDLFSNVRDRGRARLRAEGAARGPRLHPGGCPRRDRLRGSRSGGAQLAHRARGSHDRRHDLRQRRLRRHGAGRCAQAARRDRSALGARAAVPQRRDHRDGRRRGRAGPPRDGRRLAREQVPPPRRAPGSRRDHPGRLVHPPDVGRSAATACCATTDRWERSHAASAEPRPSATRWARHPAPSPACGCARALRSSPRSARARAWTGCSSTWSTRPTASSRRSRSCRRSPPTRSPRSCACRSAMSSRSSRCSTSARRTSSCRWSRRPTRRAPPSRPCAIPRAAGAASARRWPGRAGGTASTAYLENADDHVSLFVQIETAAGVDAAAEIAAVDGVDGVFVGPSDLAASMGVLGQQTHPDVEAAVLRTFEAVRARRQAGRRQRLRPRRRRPLSRRRRVVRARRRRCVAARPRLRGARRAVHRRRRRAARLEPDALRPRDCTRTSRLRGSPAVSTSG